MSVQKITIFQHANYQGLSQELPIGNYNINALAIGNDTLSSLKIPAGLKVTLYEHANFQGRIKVFTQDTPYVGNDFNDITSAIKVELLVAQTVANTVSPELAQQLQAALDRGLGSWVPGAVVGVSAPQGKWFGSTGLAELANERAMQPYNLLGIGSITHLFVATRIFQLIQEGRLSFEDTIDQWISQNIIGTLRFHERIKVIHLLKHRSGVFDAFNFVGVQLADPSLSPEELDALIKSVNPNKIIATAAEQGPRFAPGVLGWFSAPNFVLLGLIIEGVTQNTLANEIRSSIVTPLGLNDTFFPPQETVVGNLAIGYSDFFDLDGVPDVDGIPNVTTTPDNLNYRIGLEWANANMVSSAFDLIKFAEALFSGQLFRQDLLNEMLVPAEIYTFSLLIPELPPEMVPLALKLAETAEYFGYEAFFYEALEEVSKLGYGKGMMVLEDPSVGTFYGYLGTCGGYSANLFYYPQQKITIAVLNNRSGAEQGNFTVIPEILQTLLSQPSTTIADPKSASGVSAFLATGGMSRPTAS